MKIQFTLVSALTICMLSTGLLAEETNHVFCVDVATRQLVFMTPPTYDPADPPPEIGKIFNPPTGRTVAIKVTEVQYAAGYDNLPDAVVNQAIAGAHAETASLKTLNPETRAVIKGLMSAFNAKLPAEQQVTTVDLEAAIIREVQRAER